MLSDVPLERIMFISKDKEEEFENKCQSFIYFVKNIHTLD